MDHMRHNEKHFVKEPLSGQNNVFVPCNEMKQS